MLFVWIGDIKGDEGDVIRIFFYLSHWFILFFIWLRDSLSPRQGKIPCVAKKANNADRVLVRRLWALAVEAIGGAFAIPTLPLRLKRLKRFWGRKDFMRSFLASWMGSKWFFCESWGYIQCRRSWVFGKIWLDAMLITTTGMRCLFLRAPEITTWVRIGQHCWMK